MFEGYTKTIYCGPEYLKDDNGEYKIPRKGDKQCDFCFTMAMKYNNFSNFWCKHRKKYMKKFHPFVRY